ncbi:DUF1565 domain-containing protein [Odoribacter sp. Z80]|uniref:DUF1565 domain-containing protein n=1 Tax=Odoribacter sp. Z80 TaxID=2304575 RepID=UPI00137B4D43|nr:DUF1565 domain-containing protein [Odoribacter sp. Z80]NCE71988.1 DUF1565 domain-containing protein [Odoribacter sp. Z80]
MKSVWLIVLLWCMGWELCAQRLVYVGLDWGSDSGSGGIETPYLSLKKALSVARANDEVRLLIRENGNKAVFETKGELVIPAGVKVSGGYNKKGEKISDSALKIVVEGDGSNRVFKVYGELEGVTVTGGKCKGANGGGVYVATGGKVQNCIITGNTASYQLPKVGDLLMKDGSYMDVGAFTYDQMEQVKGVVFWVNPDKSAASPKGWAVSPYTDEPYKWWAASSNSITGADPASFLNLQEALLDLNGKENTLRFQNNPNCGIIQRCLAFGGSGDFYLPSLGQLYRLLVGWDEVENTFEELWRVIRESNDLVKAQDFYGRGVRSVWTNSNCDKDHWSNVTFHFMHQQAALLASSTLYNNSMIWGLVDIAERANIQNQLARSEINFVYVTEF